jgi:hypothetical protein
MDFSEEDLAPAIMKKILLRAAVALLAALLLAYVGDAIQVRVRLAQGGPSSAYDTVTVVYAAGLKNSKMEVYADNPQQVTCSRTLFPQMGYSPCWYVRGHSTEMLD